jgi:hypothetical protein
MPPGNLRPQRVSHVPSSKVREVAAMLKAIHAGEDIEAARQHHFSRIVLDVSSALKHVRRPTTGQWLIRLSSRELAQIFCLTAMNEATYAAGAPS